MPAGEAKPQMHPIVSSPQTLFAAIAARRGWSKLIGMCATLCHHSSRQDSLYDSLKVHPTNRVLAAERPNVYSSHCLEISFSSRGAQCAFSATHFAPPELRHLYESCFYKHFIPTGFQHKTLARCLLLFTWCQPAFAHNTSFLPTSAQRFVELDQRQ